jgi:outer membrane receptor protein involved in Fe transport
MLKNICLTLFAFIFSHAGFAQYQGAGGNRGTQNMNMGHFYGKVVDETTDKPIENASVQLSQTKFDQKTRKRGEFVVAVMLTGKKGQFSIDKLPILTTYHLLITAVGYKPFTESLAFDLKMGGGRDYSQMINAVDRDLGNIKMIQNAQQLQTVVITGEKKLMDVSIDRKVFNVSQSLTSVGGTAIDVMRNIPSVNVDIDGNVTLRNATPTIFIDGRPTTLTLDQIPADEIESVEVITNPSAKFDASGGGSGILNIILKKNTKPGYNGNVRANVDSRERFGLGADVNIKQGKINFFANTMYNERKTISTQTTQRTDNLDNVVAFLSQNDKPTNTGHFAFARAGFDYLMDNRNTFTFSGLIVNGKFNSIDELNILRDTTEGSLFTQQKGLTNSNSNFTFTNKGGTVSFKHNYAKANKNITADLNYFSSANSNSRYSGTQYYDLNNNPTSPFYQQLSTGSGSTKYFIGQTDYTNPITDKIKVEAGLRAAIRNYSSVNDNFTYDETTSKYIGIPALNSQYQFDDAVYAGYTTFSQKINKFSYELGGRLESSYYTGKLIDSNEVFKNSFPFSFFPSAYFTEKINDNQDIQLNYSRKINRPSFFQLIPYYNYTDSLNISRGNPNLKPEFTDLFEFSYDVNFKKGNSFIATAYYRHTTGLITQYQYISANPNPADNDSIFITSYANANSSSAYGLELIAINNLYPWWTLTSNVNVYNSKLNGTNLQKNLNNQQVSWFGKINNTFKLPSNFSIQFTGDYTSKIILPPNRSGGGGGNFYGGGALSLANGYTEPVYGFDMAIKKDFLKNKAASLSLSMNDIFRTRTYTIHSESQISPTVYSNQVNVRIRDPQILRLNFNFHFGKTDVSLFKRKNMQAEQEGIQNGMQGVNQ